MIYERPRLVPFKATTAKGGIDCVAGPTAVDKCQNGGTATSGDCDTGNRANHCKAGGVANTSS